MVSNQYSSVNTFKKIQIPEKHVDELLTSKVSNKIMLMAISIPFLLLIIIVSRYWNMDLSTVIYIVSMLGFAIILSMGAQIQSIKKMRKYEPNKII